MCEKPAIVEGPDEEVDGFAGLGREVGHLGLSQQVFLQGSLADQGVEHALPALGILRGVRLCPAGLAQVVAPVVIDFAENLELLGEIQLLAGIVAVRWLRIVFLRRRFQGLGAALRRQFLKGGIGLQLLLNHRAEIEGGNLQNAQRLPQLGRQD